MRQLQRRSLLRLTGRKSFFPLLAGFIWGAACLPAAAQLNWKEKEIDLHPGVGDADAIAHYHFQNTGKTPIKISNVDTSCPCTTAHADKAVYAPGESGVITADYSIPIVNGLEEKQIFVTTDQSPKPDTLDLKIFLPVFMKVNPPGLSWGLNENPAPKIITVEMTAQPVMNVVQALWGSMGKHHFKASFSTVEPHKKYVIIVTPDGTDKAMHDTLRIETDYPSFQAKALFLPIRVGPDDQKKS